MLKVEESALDRHDIMRDSHADVSSMFAVRDYHASRYVPQNITLIVNGRSLNPTNLLNTITEKVIPSIARHGQANGPHPQGWVRTSSRLARVTSFDI